MLWRYEISFESNPQKAGRFKLETFTAKMRKNIFWINLLYFHLKFKRLKKRRDDAIANKLATHVMSCNLPSLSKHNKIRTTKKFDKFSMCLDEKNENL